MRARGVAPASAEIVAERIALIDSVERRQHYGGAQRAGLANAFGVPAPEHRRLRDIGALARAAATDRAGDADLEIRTVIRPAPRPPWTAILAASLGRDGFDETEVRDILAATGAALVVAHRDIDAWLAPATLPPAVVVRAPPEHPGVAWAVQVVKLISGHVAAEARTMQTTTRLLRNASPRPGVATNRADPLAPRQRAPAQTMRKPDRGSCLMERRAFRRAILCFVNQQRTEAGDADFVPVRRLMVRAIRRCVRMGRLGVRVRSPLTCCRSIPCPNRSALRLRLKSGVGCLDTHGLRLGHPGWWALAYDLTSALRLKRARSGNSPRHGASPG